MYRGNNRGRMEEDLTKRAQPAPAPPVPTPNRTTTPNMPNPAKPIPDPKEAAKSNSMSALRQLGQSEAPPTPSSDIHMLSIIGQIEGHMMLPPKNKTTKYEHILPQLMAIEENPSVKGLLVILNTVGGDIEAGLAIAEMLASMTKPTVSLVLGGGHSIGVPIAVAADYSLIAQTASMTIHPIRLTGLVISVPQTYEYLEKMQDRVVRFVTAHSKISDDRFRDLMFQTGELVRDVGTVLVGEAAVKEGLINEVGGLSHALQHLRSEINEQEPGLH